MCNKEASTSVLSDAKNDYMIVAGVNHKMTDRVRYTSLTVLGEIKLNSVGSISDSNYTGSAEVYFNDPVSKYLYAFIFARDCSTHGKYCF